MEGEFRKEKTLLGLLKYLAGKMLKVVWLLHLKLILFKEHSLIFM